jgi:DNA polymerase III alpha subunit
MTNLVPTQLASKGILIAQFDLKSVERLGLVKIDLLGTRGLTVLGDLAEKIHTWRSIEFPNSLSVLDGIPEEDPETTTLLKKTHTIGCFSIESPGMRATLREISACSLDDIMIALALYRPGPMAGGLKDSFVRRHLGQEPVVHIHAALANLLESTYGVILYQEQVLQIASELAGLSLSDADLLRRAMSHFDPGDRMKTLKVRFVEGASKKSGVPISTGERIWEMMAAFAGYGFPKAHAASYAQVAWRSVWCKAHYPAEFMSAVLAGWGGYYRQNVYLNEARRLGLTIRPPHINHSKQQFSTNYPEGIPTLYMGLDQVRDLSRATQRRILTERPFNSFDDFLTQVDPRPKEAANLIRVGALTGLGSIPELLAQTKAGGWRLGQPRLFDLTFNEEPDEEWDLCRRVEEQIKILGIGVDAHPTDLVKDQIDAIGAVTTNEAGEMLDSVVRVTGIRQTIQRFHTSGGSAYYILELDDPSGVLSVRLSEPIYNKYRGALSSWDPFFVEGLIIQDDFTNMVLLEARRVEPLRSDIIG